MQEYRVYCLDDEGRSVETQHLEATSDQEAVLKAQRLTGLRKCEVWSGNRLVARVTEFDPVA